MILGGHSWTWGHLAFTVVMAGAFGFFAFSAWRLIKLFQVGKADPRLKDVVAQAKRLAVVGLGQKKLFRDPVAGPMHAGIFWGFCVITIGTLEMMAKGIHPALNLSFLGPLYGVILLGQDLFALLVLCMILFAVYRRLVVKPDRLASVARSAKLDALFILTLIFTLMVSLFGVEGAARAAGEAHFPAWVQPVSAVVGLGLAGLDLEALSTFYTTSWWIHMLVVLAFLNFLPYSKHFHVIGSLPNVFLSSTQHHGKLLPMDLEDEEAEQFGAADVQDLSWKMLLDGYTCTECGRCHEVCPAQNTGKPLSPRKIVTDVRHRLEDRSPPLMALAQRTAIDENGHVQLVDDEKRLIHEDYITEEELWACTSCRACEQECPVMIEHVPTIMELRRYLALTEGNMPAEAVAACKNMETNYTPWAMSHATRGDWANDLEVKTLAEDSDVEYLFWAGCAGCYDDRYRKVARDTVEILKAGGVKFGILGGEEMCTGDSARRIGNEYLFQSLAQTNVEVLNGYGVKKVVTGCPHCLHTIGNEYEEFGGDYEVVHHSELIEELVEQGKVKLNGASNGAKVTFHDPCYLGRYNDVYDAPRKLQTLATSPIQEMDRSRDRSFCCGAGGGRMWMEEDVDQRVNVARAKEAIDTGANVIGTGCPFCMTMMTDGLKAHEKEEIEVLDVAEQVRKAMVE